MHKKIEQEKDKCPILYDFLNKYNYKLDNIYLSGLPSGNYMYIEYSKKTNQMEVMSKIFATTYHTTNNDLKKYLSKCDKVFIYPHEDEYNKMNMIKHAYSQYDDYLRLWINNGDKFILQNTRKIKIQRLFDDD